MTPRRAFKEPMSRLAVWSLRLVGLGAAFAGVAVLAGRSDWLEGAQVVTALAIGIGVIGLGMVTALAAGAVIWVTGYGGARYAVLAFLAGAIISAYPATLAAIGLSQPALPDITTDTVDPPAFDLIATVRPQSANPVRYPAEFAAIQQRLYPEIRTLDVDLPASDVNDIVTELIDGQRWRLLDQVDYRPDRAGRFEMVTRSLVLGLRDDIVIRIRQSGARSRIDIRSAARYGRQDFGVNARRVIAALNEMRAAVRRVQRER